MAATPIPLIARPRLVFPRFGPDSGSSVRVFPARNRHHDLTAPRRSGVDTPTSPLRPGAIDLPVDALVGQAIDLALENLNRLERQARDAARAFRVPHGAGDGLSDVMHTLQGLGTLAAAAAGAIGLDFDRFCATRGVDADGETRALLNELLFHQRVGNRHGLAAALEGRVGRAIEAWRRVFAGLASVPIDPDPSGFAA